MQRAFPELPDTGARYAISRARNGCTSNPVFRLSGWFDEARDAGFSSAAADEVISYLKIRRDQVWHEESLCFIAESRAEQLIDGDEDVLQHRALLEVAAIPNYVEMLDSYIARAMRLRRAAMARYEGERRP